jgi:hypothetical protein
MADRHRFLVSSLAGGNVLYSHTISWRKRKLERKVLALVVGTRSRLKMARKKTEMHVIGV